VVELEQDWSDASVGPNEEATMISVASANVLPKAAMQKIMQYLSIYGFECRRTHLDVVKDGDDGGTVSMIRLLVLGPDDSAKTKDVDWEILKLDLKRLKWVDNAVIALASEKNDNGDKSFTLLEAEVCIALQRMIYGVMHKINPYAFTVPRIMELATQPLSLAVARDISRLFLDRFDPGKEQMTEDDYRVREENIHGKIVEIDQEDAQLLLQKMLLSVGSVLRSNVFLEDRFALAMRVDPTILGVNEVVGTSIPFGTFFVYGRRFVGFHVRFRDIARGGLRVVAPTNTEQHLIESARQYDEVYSLAFAQQLKNKDIPEGGSKAVVLVDPSNQGSAEVEVEGDFRHYLVRKSVKAFGDAILDMVTTDTNVQNQLVNYYGQNELIYLGPDENVIPEDINWLVDRAAYRGYPVPAAFMSSKPDAGINHKEFGVTSEGVAVFLDVALKEAAGIDGRREPFTVKITGGPDGDVAGNMIKILAREYGDNARIVGISDGFGTAEDPDGLQMDELLRLFKEELPIVHYQGKLGPEGVCIAADTQEGVKARNTMHNRVKADVFVPAGGRPETINISNWEQYLLEDGSASSKLVVEGANLFITPAARQALFDKAGVIIVKDSSANKCGVITSSYEIMSSMMLTKDEFMAIKEELVADVLTKLRQLALVEAELMFREHNKNPTQALPPYSELISECIMRVHDATDAALEDIEDTARQELITKMLLEHLPGSLKDVGLDRVWDTVPVAYLKQVVCAATASKIVYREGLSYIQALPDEPLASIAFKYLQEEQKVLDLVGKVQGSGLDEDAIEEISDLLLRGGVRVGVESSSPK